MSGGHSPDGGAGGGVQVHWHLRARRGEHGRPRPVRRQVQQRRRPCQLLLPPGQLLLLQLADIFRTNRSKVVIQKSELLGLIVSS